MKRDTPSRTTTPTEREDNVHAERLLVSGDVERLTHYLFRYPAKFHPPVVRALLERYTERGNLVLDPFCGSGTLMVEALVAGRSSLGIDVDPVAALVSAAKTHRFNPGHLDRSAQALIKRLGRMERTASDYERLMRADLSSAAYEEKVKSVQPYVPDIPNLFHWFRRYVIIDLAKIRRTISLIDVPSTHRALFEVVFASIIRNASNADPVPVSGLEVTAHMKRRDAEGRLVNPFDMYYSALRRAVEAHRFLAERADRSASARAFAGDATALATHLRSGVDAVITSPPYHGAVDYYRRHQLEMFWLGATESQADRLGLLQHYIGRPKVAQSHPFVAEGVLATALAKEWEDRIRNVSSERADAFRHYLVAMTRFFDGLAVHLRSGAPVVMVVGHSSWNESQIPTTELFREITHDTYTLSELLWYPVKNRYMSYARRNGADINIEYVLVLRRR